MEEFLKTLYKVCSTSTADGLDLIFDTIPGLLEPEKFAELNKFLKVIDLSRVSVSCMLGLVNMTDNYRFQLSHWAEFYGRCREECARRGETDKHIKELFDQYLEVGQSRLYNPNAPPYISPEQKQDDLINNKIALAKATGDKELETLLTYYQGTRQDRKDRERKFRQLRRDCGDETLRIRCVAALREVADKLEQSAGGWPDIYYCNLPEDPLLSKTFIDGIEVVISYPWPG
jgi:hypothetical protein